MITASFIFIGKIVLMMIIIGAMIMILMSIGHLLHNDDLNTAEDDSHLKDELERDENVVGEKSVFYNFLVKAERARIEKNPRNKREKR